MGTLNGSFGIMLNSTDLCDKVNVLSLFADLTVTIHSFSCALMLTTDLSYYLKPLERCSTEVGGVQFPFT